MSVPNFSFLACLEVAEKCGGVGWGVGHVATMSNLTNQANLANLANLTNLATSRHARKLKFGTDTH